MNELESLRQLIRSEIDFRQRVHANGDALQLAEIHQRLASIERRMAAVEGWVEALKPKQDEVYK